MATRAALPARSLHGCWTCRVRKKKCDENQPVCSKCVAFKLECHGYGSKPMWMDNGPLQREQARNIKRIVSQTGSKRRQQSMLRPSSPILDISLEMSTVSEGTFKASGTPSKYSPEGASLVEADGDTMVLRGEAQFYAWNTDLQSFESGILSGSSEENLFITESFSNNREWESNICFDNSQCVGNEALPSRVPKGSWVSEVKSIPTPSTSTVERGSGEWTYGMSREGMHPSANNASGAGWSWSGNLTPAQSLSTNKVVKEYSISAEYPTESVLYKEMEDKLLMHYLDEVFYIQYPFYNSLYKRSRGWLFSTIRRVRSVYYATLALSQQHIQSTEESFLLPTLSRKINYRDVAVREMELSLGEPSSWSGTPSLDRSVQCTTCILQNLFCELFAGGTGNWQSYLLTAATSMMQLVQARMMAIGPGLTGQACEAQQAQERAMYFWDDTGTEVLLGSFISLDIMACASTRSQPSLQLDHKHILETFGIDLGSLFGCESQVMALIFEVVLLDNWKKEAEKTRKLSMVDLVKRAATIEDRLQQKVRDIESTQSPGSNTLESSGSTPSTCPIAITYIFALSALTYLHVVVSGASPELPEIAESVSKTVVAFQCLTDPRLLQNLVWPFCVTGCLAQEGQQGLFRDLVSNAKINLSTIGTCLQAFQIIEECWEMRKACSYNCDWAVIMNKQGCNVLLI